MALRMTHSVQAIEVIFSGRQIPLADLVVHFVDVIAALRLRIGGRFHAAALITTCGEIVVETVIVRLFAQVNGVSIHRGRVRIGDRRLP